MNEIPERIKLANLPTKIEKLERFSERLGGPAIYIKRDDQTGIEISGNKVRKLEYAVAEAISQGADTLITCGGIQSNHARATAAVAAKLGLNSFLVLRSDNPETPDGNHFLDKVLGAEIKIISREEYSSSRMVIMEGIKDELKAKGRKKRWLGILFSILLIGCVGFIFASVHTNAIVSSFDKAFGINPLIGGIVIALVTSLVIFGGVRRIATVTEYLVPFMAVIYLCVTGYILVTNINMIPDVFSLIVKSAFGFTQFAGGLAGVTVQIVMRTGISRGLFSNEAGQGTAPNAAGTAETSHPVKQGLIQAMGVFFDTLIICSATAFVIILAGAYNSGIHEGVQLTQESISYFVGSWGHIFVAVSILMFAFSSIIGNYYYGETNLLFITEKKKYLFAYRFTLILWILFGSFVNVSQIWNMADFAMGLMTVVNLIALVCLGKFAMQALDHYQYQLKEGKNPVFYKNSLDNPGDIECWNNDNNDIETKTVKEIYDLESLATTTTTTTTTT